MNRKTVNEKLIALGHEPAKVATFLNYVRELETDKDSNGKLRAWWLSKIDESQLISAYQKVAIDGLYIDGETITLTFRKKLQVTYDYQAYKNRMLMVYPETKIDLQIVKEGDTYSSWKESGKVHYMHKIKDPFAKVTPDNLKGSYVVIKNSRGEFLEELGPDDIAAMRGVSQSDNIWKKWYSEMVLKSVMKRACKRHFRDKFANMERLDNENYDLDAGQVTTTKTVFQEIEAFTDADKLLAWAAHPDQSAFHQDQAFRSSVSEKLKQLGYVPPKPEKAKAEEQQEDEPENVE